MNLRLKEMRVRSGLKQKELAERLSVDWRTYGSWERGERGLTLENAYNCAIALNCTIDEIAGMPPRHASFSDQGQQKLNECYEKMNESGKTLLVESAKSISADPERRIIKDRQEHLDDTGAIGA